MWRTVSSALDDKAPTDSRISLLTGVHRKDVRRLRNTSDPAASTLPENITFGAQLVNAWAKRALLQRRRPATATASIGQCRRRPLL